LGLQAYTTTPSLSNILKVLKFYIEKQHKRSKVKLGFSEKEHFVSGIQVYDDYMEGVMSLSISGKLAKMTFQILSSLQAPHFYDTYGKYHYCDTFLGEIILNSKD
jgi:hypothetical protein